MNSWVEGALALAITLLLGVGLWLFSGEPLGGSPPDTAAPVGFDPEAAARGEVLATEAGCVACHSSDGAPGTGPTWKGLAGSSRPLAGGESVVADDSYLFNSIVDPQSQLVAGFDPVMPTTYAEQLTEEEVTDLVEYIQSLG